MRRISTMDRILILKVIVVKEKLITMIMETKVEVEECSVNFVISLGI